MAITEETTETIETTVLGETLIIPSEDKGKSYCSLRVCCHNTVNTIVINIPNPTSSFVSWDINASLFSPNVAVSEVERFGVIPNPILESDTHSVYPEIALATLDFFQWNVNAVIPNPILNNYAPQNVSPSISRTVSNHNPFNSSPSINVEIVKTP